MNVLSSLQQNEKVDGKYFYPIIIEVAWFLLAKSHNSFFLSGVLSGISPQLRNTDSDTMVSMFLSTDASWPFPNYSTSSKSLV